MGCASCIYPGHCREHTYVSPCCLFVSTVVVATLESWEYSYLGLAVCLPQEASLRGVLVFSLALGVIIIRFRPGWGWIPVIGWWLFFFGKGQLYKVLYVETNKYSQSRVMKRKKMRMLKILRRPLRILLSKLELWPFWVVLESFQVFLECPCVHHHREFWWFQNCLGSQCSSFSLVWKRRIYLSPALWHVFWSSWIVAKVLVWCLHKHSLRGL